MTVSQVLLTLKRKGMVTRVCHPNDRRAHATSVTATGRPTERKELLLAIGTKEEFFSVLGPDERHGSGTLENTDTWRLLVQP
jgi:DNA-binding MarR family transcriptional regulator